MRKAIIYIAVVLLAEVAVAQIQTKAYAQTRVVTLDECKALAGEHSYDLLNKQLDIEAAQQLKNEALTKFFPKIEAMGLYANSAKPLLTLELPNPATGSLMALSMLKNGKVAAVSAIQPIFAGGQIVNANKLAKVGEEVQTLQLSLTEEDTEKQVEQRFWQIVKLKENMLTVEAMNEMLQAIKKDVNIAIQAGIRTRNDLLRVQMQECDLESTRLKIENGIGTSTLLLKQLTGLEGDVELKYDDISSPASPASLYVEASVAAAQRPEAELLTANVRAAQLQKRSQLGKMLPSVGVGAAYLYHDWLKHNYNTALFSVNVSIPISDWWGGSHALKKKRLEQQKAENERQNSLELLAVKIENAWGNLQEAYNQVVLQQKSVASATENLRVNRNYYQAGTIAISDLLDAQSILQQSRDKLTSALTDYQLSRTEYRLLTNQ